MCNSIRGTVAGALATEALDETMSCCNASSSMRVGCSKAAVLTTCSFVCCRAAAQPIIFKSAVALNPNFCWLGLLSSCCCLQVAAVKQPLLQKAAQRLLSSPKFSGLRSLMSKFRADNPWLEDSALFDALRQQPDLVGLDWWEWPEPLRFRKGSAIKDAHKTFKAQVDEFVAVQFLFDRQWRALKVRTEGRHTRLGCFAHASSAYEVI